MRLAHAMHFFSKLLTAFACDAPCRRPDTAAAAPGTIAVNVVSKLAVISQCKQLCGAGCILVDFFARQTVRRSHTAMATADASAAHAARKQRLVSESNKYETVEELVYVNRQKKFLTEEQAQLQMCSCKTREADKDGPICTSAQCENVASRTECPMGTCSKKRCQNKRFQRREWAQMEVFEVSAELA